MSNTYIADSTDDSKNDDTLIIIVNADGTLSVDPETLQKLIANQHHKTGISVVRVGGDGSNTCGDGTCGDTNDAKGSSGEVNSHVNLTVEGFYPPEHAAAAKTAEIVPPSTTVSPQTPPSTPTAVPSATSTVPSDNGGADALSDPFLEMDAEEIQKLETALQSEQAKQILGENVTAMLDMLNVEDGGSNNSGSNHISHQEAVRMDHCYTNLSGPTTTTTVTTVQSVVTTSVTSPSTRGRGRGKGGRGRGAVNASGPAVLQMKGIPSGATLVPVVKQLVLPVSAIHPGTVTVNKLVTTTGNTVGQNVQLQRPVQRVIVQNNTVIASEPAIGGAGLLQLQQNAKVVVTKINAIPTPAVVTPVTATTVAPSTAQPSVVSAANKEATVSTEFETDFLNKKITVGRGRARTRGAMRGRGVALGVPKKRVGGRGGGVHKLNAEEEERARRLEEEMAAALEAMSSSPKQEQFIAVVDTPQDEDTGDVPKKEILNKVTEKKVVPLKVGKKAEDGTTKKVKDKTVVPAKVIPQKVKASRKSADSITSDVSTASDDKVLSPLAVTASVTTSVIQPRSTTATVVASSAPTTSPSTPGVLRKNYPKRENRKPPAHLVDTLGPALFSTPDIIRRVSTDKLPMPPVSTSPVTTSPSSSVTSPVSVTSPLPTTTAQQPVMSTVTSSTVSSPPNVPSQTVPAQTTTTSSSLQQKTHGTGLQDELSLIDGTGESLLDSIHAQVTKQEEQLLAEALMLDDLPSVQTDEISEEPVKEVATRKASVSGTRERRKSSSDSKKRSMDSNDSDGQMGGSEDDDDESWNSEDDPDRLWCICKKPHNNRFMICCDTCEDWFHGKCVGITKAMGEQMEEKGIEWSCPNCKKKRAVEVKEATKKQVEQKKELKKPNSQDLIKPGPAKSVEAKETRSSRHVPNILSDDTGLPGTAAATHIQSSSGASGGHCIVCKKEPSPGSIYCSDDCIKKHASESLALISKEKVSGGSAPQSVIVFERKTGRLLAGPSAPLASGLTSWLLTHPTFEVMCPGVLPTAKFYTQKSASSAVSTQQKTPLTKSPAVAQKVQKQTSAPLLRQTLLVPRTIVKTTTPATVTTTTAPASQVTPVQKPQVGSTSGPKLQQTTLPVSNTKVISTQGLVTVKQEPSAAVTIKAVLPAKSPAQKIQVVTIQKSQQLTALPKGQQQLTHLLKSQQQQQVNQEAVSEPARINTVRTTSVSSTSSMSPPSSSSSISVTTKKHASSTVKEANKKQKQSKLNLTTVKKPIKEENKVELKRSDSQSSTGKREDGPEPVRENVRKTLQESLMSRLKECEDISVKEQEVKTIAQNIEEELHALFKDTGTKYKSKYRSLVFNIKDPKNLTLFRKIVDSSISPQQLVRLSAEEMASQELAQWREREARHQLEMIKKNELDLMQQAKTVVMKTHKGELVIENEDSLGSKNPDTSVTELETALSESISEPAVEPVKEKETVSKKDDKHEKEKEDKDKRKHSSRKKEDRHRDRKRSRKSRSHDKEYKRDRSRSRSKSRSRSRNRRHSDKGRDIKKDDTKIKEKKTEESDFKTKFEETESHLSSEIKEIVEEVIQEEVIQETGDIQEEDLTEEPSSTVNIKTPPYIESETENKPALWRGYLLMNDVAKFATTIQEVSGDCEELPNDLPETIDCVGRIHPETVWEYIAKMKKSGSKQILVIRFSPENEEEKMSYLSLYSYLSSKNRMGVVGNASVMIKDFYVMPLASHNPVPQVLLPLDGPGFEDYRPHLLLGIIVRTRRKRLMTDRDLPFIPKVLKRTERSYTPPLPDEGNSTPVQAAESFTPPHRSPKFITLKHKSSRHSTRDPPFSPPGEDIIEDGDAPYSPADEDTPYSPGEGEDEEMPPPPSPGDMQVSAELQRKMDELNRRIEEQKQQIQSIVAHSGNIAAVGIMDSQEDEAYSPSRSFTPPPTAVESIPFLDNQALPDIALPSNLQEILASIKKHPEPKGLTLKLDPIVQAYSKSEEPYSPEDKLEPPIINEVDDYTAASVTPPDTISAQQTPAPVKINRDPRQRGDAKSIRTSLSQLSDEDLIRKAAEMGFMNPENPETLNNESIGKSLVDQPPPPGLEDEYHGYDTVQKPVKSAPVNSGPGPPMMPSSASSYPPPAAPYNGPPPYGPPPYPMYPPNFSSQPVYQQSQHIPFTNPQPPPPPQPIFQPPPPQPPPPQPQPLPPPPKESSSPAKKEHTLMTRKLKKSNLGSSGDKLKAARKFSEQSKSYGDGKESLRKREKFLHKRGRRQNWEPVEKRKGSWNYEQQSLPSSSSMRGVMRGRYPHPRGFPMRRGFDHSNRGYHRGFHRQRGHPMGPPRGGYPPKHHSGIQNEWDETIRHFEVKHRERNNKLKRRIERERRWRGGSSPPRKKRSKDSDSED